MATQARVAEVARVAASTTLVLVLVLLGCAEGSVDDGSGAAAEKEEAGIAVSPGADAGGAATIDAGPDDAPAPPAPPEDTGAPPPADAGTLDTGSGLGSDDAGAADLDAGAPSSVSCGVQGLSCSGATPLCCQSSDSSGAPKYACTSSSGCADYPIKCGSAADCVNADDGGGDICCHYRTNTTCAAVAHCIPSHFGEVVCTGGASGACPAGTSCQAIAGSVYLACQ